MSIEVSSRRPIIKSDRHFFKWCHCHMEWPSILQVTSRRWKPIFHLFPKKYELEYCKLFREFCTAFLERIFQVSYPPRRCLFCFLLSTSCMIWVDVWCQSDIFRCGQQFSHHANGMQGNKKVAFSFESMEKNTSNFRKYNPVDLEKKEHCFMTSLGVVFWKSEKFQRIFWLNGILVP